MTLLPKQIVNALSMTALLCGTWAFAAAGDPAKPKKGGKKDTSAAKEEPKAVPPPVEFNAGDVWNSDISTRVDHKVLVLQDRRYTKAKKFELGVHGGVMNSSPFYTSVSKGVHADYYFSEYLGLDTFWNSSSNSLSADANQIDEFLKRFDFPSKKEYQAPKQFYGFALLWSPIYGKFAFFRKSIIHFDIYGSAGMAILTSESNKYPDEGGRNQTHKGSLASLGMRVFLNKYWSLRFDARHTLYNSYFAAVGSINNPGAAVTLLRQSFQFTLGTSFVFGLGR